MACVPGVYTLVVCSFSTSTALNLSNRRRYPAMRVSSYFVAMCMVITYEPWCSRYFGNANYETSKERIVPRPGHGCHCIDSLLDGSLRTTSCVMGRRAGKFLDSFPRPPLLNLTRRQRYLRSTDALTRSLGRTKAHQQGCKYAASLDTFLIGSQSAPPPENPTTEMRLRVLALR